MRAATILLVTALLAPPAFAEERIPEDPVAQVDAGETCVFACYAADGKQILLATAEGLIRRRDATTLADLGEVRLPFHGVLWIGLRDEGKSIAAGLPDGTVRVCDATTGKERSRIDAGAKECTSIALAPDGRLLATGGSDGRLLLWWVPTRSTVQEIPAHAGPVTRIAFSPDSRFVTTAGSDRVWRVWEVATAGNVLAWDGIPEIGALAFHPSGWRVYALRHPSAGDVACVIEVSESSLRQDRTEKSVVYAAAGIPQYVIVNLVDDRLEVFTQPRVRTGKYARVAHLKAGATVSLSCGGGQHLEVPVRDLLP